MATFQQVYVDQTVEIPLYYRKNVELRARASATSFANGTQVGSTWNGEDWFAPVSLRLRARVTSHDGAPDSRAPRCLPAAASRPPCAPRARGCTFRATIGRSVRYNQ